MEEETINLNLTVTEANTVLQHLGSGQFVKVADLITKIKSQAEAQLQPQSGTE